MHDYPVERTLADIAGLVMQVAAMGLPVGHETIANYAHGATGISVRIHESREGIGKACAVFCGSVLLLDNDSEEHKREAVLDLYNKLAAFLASRNPATIEF